MTANAFHSDVITAQPEPHDETQAARDTRGFWILAAALIVIWAACALTLGLPGLALPALTLVPIMFALLIWIARP